MTTAIENREEAVERVERGADPEWLAVALRAVEWIARERRSFTSDDVWDALRVHYPSVTTPEPRAMGVVMRRAVKLGLCALLTCDVCFTQKVVVRSRRPQANGMDTPVYLSRLFA